VASTVELETRIAFLEKHLNELSDVVYQQQMELDKLNLVYSEIKDHYLDEKAGESSGENEKPPHY